MIKSFKCKETEKIFRGKFSRKFSIQIQKIALEMMIDLDFAKTMDDIKAIDQKDFKQLKRNPKTHHDYQMRVNKQYRIRFNIVDEQAVDLEIVDTQLKDFH